MKSHRLLLALVVSFSAVCLIDARADEAAKKKIVFVAGRPSHPPGQHEHRAGCLLLSDHLNKSGLPIQAVVTDNGWPQDESIFNGASAVVVYSDGGGGHPAIQHLETLKKLAKDGVGLGCIHYAVEIPKGEPGNTFVSLLGGYFESNWSVNPHWTASFKLPKHEVTRGIADFSMLDEWYFHMRFQDQMKGVTPILSDVPPPETLSRPDGEHSGNPAVREAVARKELQHVMWAYDRPEAVGKGRSFGFTGGHFHRNWQNDNHRRVVLNAIVWISGLDVPAGGVPSKTPTDEEMQANLDKKN
jgi:type 1 glutamine amidotransferase